VLRPIVFTFFSSGPLSFVQKQSLIRTLVKANVIEGILFVLGEF